MDYKITSYMIFLISISVECTEHLHSLKQYYSTILFQLNFNSEIKISSKNKQNNSHTHLCKWEKVFSSVIF